MNNIESTGFAVRKRKRQNTIKNIVMASIELLESYGYKKTTTNHIAKKAGVSIGLIYKYFPNGKHDIIKEIYQKDYLQANVTNNLTIKNLLNSSKSEFYKFWKNLILNWIRSHRVHLNLTLALEIACLLDSKVYFNIPEWLTKEEFKEQRIRTLKEIKYKKADTNPEAFYFLISTIDTLIHRHILTNQFSLSDKDFVQHLMDLIIRIEKN